MTKLKCPKCGTVSDLIFLHNETWETTAFYCKPCDKYVPAAFTTDEGIMGAMKHIEPCSVEDLVEFINDKAQYYDEPELPPGKIRSMPNLVPFPKIMTLRGWIKEIWKW